MPGTPPLSLDARAPGVPLHHFWSNCTGAGRANEGLRASWLEHLRLVHDRCGFRYCRFHGLFHDDMFVYREVNGQPAYNWQYIDDLFDRLLDIGVRPFVALNFMPAALASTSNTTFWWKAHTSPPKDYTLWGGLVGAFTAHCVDRYGLDEVRTWYFEVWNEPDLHGFWDGTRSQYFELYKVSVQAIKAVDPHLRVGGPATSNFVPDGRFDGEREDPSKDLTLTTPDINALSWHGVWIRDFLAYCGQEGLPVDFVSTHPYPTDWALDPETKKSAGRVRAAGATRQDLEWLKETIAQSPYPHASIHLTEWSSSPSSRDPTHDSLQAAAFILRANLDCIGLADSLSYWTFTDVFEEAGAGNSIFHGGFGLINYQGIVKPSFHAYRMLHNLGDELLHREEGLVLTRRGHRVVALLYHYPQEVKDVVSGSVEGELHMGTPRPFAMRIAGVPPGAAFDVETLDADHGFAWPAWRAMGSPEPPNREQTKQLKRAAFATKVEQVRADGSGYLNWSKTLTPWNCVLIKQK